METDDGNDDDDCVGAQQLLLWIDTDVIEPASYLDCASA